MWRGDSSTFTSAYIFYRYYFIFTQFFITHTGCNLNFVQNWLSMLFWLFEPVTRPSTLLFSYFIGMYITHEKSWKNARPRSDVMIRRGAKKHVNICVCPSILPAAPPFCWLLPSKFWLMEFCGTQFRNNFQFVRHCNSWVQEVLKNDTNHANFFHLWCEKWNLSNVCCY